jgi:hypothetical protein
MQQFNSFVYLFEKALKPGGVYFIEVSPDYMHVIQARLSASLHDTCLVG